MFAVIKRIIDSFSNFKLISNSLLRAKYKGIGIGVNANLHIHGNFFYGTGCGIGEGANIVIPQDATLKIGNDCYIGRYVELGPSSNIEIGDQTSIQDRSIFVGDVIIGRYCLISLNVLISSGKHYFDINPWELIRDQDRRVLQDGKLAALHSKPVVVEDDCWIGVNAVVMPGVVVGKGAVIGANSVVTRNVAPYTVVAGAPAKVIKKRLNFIPPQRVHWENAEDLPYFYSGFEVSQSETKKHSEFGGLLAIGAFVLCLDASLGNSIHIVVRSVASNNKKLWFGGQRKEVSSQFQEIVFAQDEHSRKTCRFHFWVDSVSTPVAVREAWVE